jgi:hypothetical protein
LAELPLTSLANFWDGSAQLVSSKKKKKKKNTKKTEITTLENLFASLPDWLDASAVAFLSECVTATSKQSVTAVVVHKCGASSFISSKVPTYSSYAWNVPIELVENKVRS